MTEGFGGRAEDDATAGCHVSLLVPHATRIAVLARDAGLPTLHVASDEPLLSDIVDAADVLDPGATVLRQVITESIEQDDEADSGESEDEGLRLLVELEAGTVDPPTGWTWHDVDGGLLARLEPASARAAVARWAGERAEGWSPRRPPWSRPGWHRRAATWMADQLAAHGQPATAAPRQHQLWAISVLLRAPTAQGDAYLKCSADVFRKEATVTRDLAELMPDSMPEVIAVEETEGWLLMRDLGAAVVGEQDEGRWHEGLVAHARIQQQWLDRVEELSALGLAERSLSHLAALVQALAVDDALLARMSPELRARWLSAAPSLAELCLRMEELGPSPTLAHGDFHPFNVVLGSGHVRVFDWSDAAISHPFVDLATYCFQTEEQSLRRRLVEAYIDAWASHGDARALREAAALALVVGCLYQVQTYRTLLPALPRDGADDDLADADLQWLERSLDCHDRYRMSEEIVGG